MDHINTFSLDIEQSFETFITNKTNQKAVHISQTFIKDKQHFILYLYGNKGVGKTHLTNAIALEMQNDLPTIKIIRIKVNDLLSINSSQLKSYIQYSLIILDDADALYTNPKIADVLSKLLHKCQKLKIKIVLNGCILPNHFMLDHHLALKYKVRISNLDNELLHKLLDKFSMDMDIQLPHDVRSFISNFTSITDVREIKAILLRLKNYANEVVKKPISLELAKESLKVFLN
ncbi:hypothetical protein A1D22_00300 [Pasteurellaceae bacterium LFhippo2]|nr:hypothetical protein [Pasteurellaceae bacterium LFhippo2]